MTYSTESGGAEPRVSILSLGTLRRGSGGRPSTPGNQGGEGNSWAWSCSNFQM